MKKAFVKDRANVVLQWKQNGKEEILTEAKLATLPKAFQKYFQMAGFVDKPLAMNADVIWKESWIKLKPNQNWKSLLTLQFNAVNPIMRTSYMKVNGMFFAGKDLYQNGQGSMKGKILNLFNIINASGHELSQAALITSFAEMILLSGYFYQDYIQLEEIDDLTVKAQLTDHDFKVTGIFHFNPDGTFDYFETDDRYFDLGKGNFEKRKFIARVNNYKISNNVYQPESISCLWILDGSEYEYFKGSIDKVVYNVKQ